MQSIIGCCWILVFLAVCQDSQAILNVIVTPKSVAHFFKHEMHNLYDDLMRTRPASIHSTYLGLELTIDHLQIVDLKMPRLSYENTSTPSIINLKLIGGYAQILGQYEAVYKTKRSGQIEISMDHFDMTIGMRRIGNQLNRASTCRLSMDQLVVTLTPPLPEQITDMIQTNILEQLEASACRHASRFIDRTASQLVGGGVKTVDISGRSARSGSVDANLQLFADDVSAVTLQIPLVTINTELQKLATLATTSIHWDTIPEVQSHLEACQDPACRIIESGQVVSTLIEDSPPTIEIINDQIQLELPLETRLANDAIVLRTTCHLIITDLRLSKPEDGRVDWSATYRIRRVDVLQTRSSKFQHVVSKVENYVQQHFGFIENLLNNYLQGSLPILVSSHLTWPHHVHAMTSSSSTIDFHLHPHPTNTIRILDTSSSS